MFLVNELQSLTEMSPKVSPIFLILIGEKFHKGHLKCDKTGIPCEKQITSILKVISVSSLLSIKLRCYFLQVMYIWSASEAF
jgi:hypothetical protein